MNITVNNQIIKISDDDFNFIAERCNTSASGTVSFSKSAVSRYRKITHQKIEANHVIKLQMLQEFGRYA